MGGVMAGVWFASCAVREVMLHANVRVSKPGEATIRIREMVVGGRLRPQAPPTTHSMGR